MLPVDMILFYSTLLGSNRLNDADTLPPPQFDHTDYSLALQILFRQPYTFGSQTKVFTPFLVGGAVAQMGERRVRNAKVRSSILLGSTN